MWEKNDIQEDPRRREVSLKSLQNKRWKKNQWNEHVLRMEHMKVRTGITNDYSGVRDGRRARGEVSEGRGESDTGVDREVLRCLRKT